MIAATICSGIGAPEVAMPHWQWAFASEIEAAPRAIMAYRHGAEDARHARTGTGPALWGDFTAIRVRLLRRLGITLPQWLVAGTPCQSFSVAGLRGGMADARGNLTMEFLRLVHALRRAGSLRGFLWENVPGILSHADNPFGCFLAGVVGSDTPIVSPLQRGRWPRAGMVDGPFGKAAWIVKDAQYFGLAQRRARVLVVASFVDGIDPAAVLFERCGVSGHSAPRREQGKAAPTLPSRSSGGGGLGTDFDLDGGLIREAFGGGQHERSDRSSRLPDGEGPAGGL
jgi:Site-specific DNA methylase